MFELLVLVDPDQEILDTFRRFLERQGYSVATAAQGPEAMRHLRLKRPNLIVIEPMLTDDWGERVLEQCRRSAADVPVIGLSKRSSFSMLYPFCAYHVKPISLFSLLETIQTSLQAAACDRH
jgi:DNA-binding response OmpR family regulator